MGKPWPAGGAATLGMPAADAATAQPVVAPMGTAAAAQALRLHARLLQARSLRAAAQALVNELGEQAGLQRVSLALTEPGPAQRLRLLASNGPDRIDVASLWRDQVLGAMAETRDQGLAACWPPARAAPPAPATAPQKR